MSVEFTQDIGFSNRTKAAYIVPQTGGEATARANVSVPKESLPTPAPYAYWGSNNDLPIKMAEDIEGCGVLDAGLDAKARIAVGKGPKPFLLLDVDKEGKEDLEAVLDREIGDWMDTNDSFSLSINSMFDKLAYGWNAYQLLLSRNRERINRVFRTDIYQCRLEKMDKNGFINNLYIGSDWMFNSSIESEYVRKVPLLEENNEFAELSSLNAGYEFAMINRQLRNGKIYYPTPLWYSAKGWVDQAKSIPRLKNALMNNQITVKYLITISEQYWRRIHKLWDTYTPDKKQQVIKDKLDEIDKYLAGVDNQYKSITAMKYVDPVTKVEISDISIEVIDDKIKDGKLLPDSQAGNSEILFALQINPALVGAGQPGGAYSNNAGGSNIREAYLIQMMMTEWERQDGIKILNLVKNKNGWADRLEVERTLVAMPAPAAPPVPGQAPTPPPPDIRHTEKKITPRLVFRHPSGLLTTLDTGKSTKGEVL
jgi:hypothetical protein